MDEKRATLRLLIVAAREREDYACVLMVAYRQIDLRQPSGGCTSNTSSMFVIVDELLLRKHHCQFWKLLDSRWLVLILRSFKLKGNIIQGFYLALGSSPFELS